MAAKLIDVRSEGRQHIDRYELVAEIASGGMATVYLARLSGVGGFQRFVAIKRLHPHLAKDDEFVQMFLDEARLAAGIHHPNVVPILEVGANERGFYLAMEYIEGDTLARLLARAASGATPLPIDIGLRIVIDTLVGLHAAHELRDDRGEPTELVHRDVSPQNILVGVDGVSRISDFGVARAATRLTATRSGQLKGKIAYMAPEQAAGQPVDRRADVFAAGIVLWEVLTARRLFKADNEAATLQRVLSGEIPSPREEVLSVPEEVASVCLKALSRDPTARFASCAQFADALERATADTLRVRVAPPKDVASYVAEVIGQEIREQRDAVRAWLAFSEPSQGAPSASSPVSVSAVGSAPTLSVGASDVTVASAVVGLPTPLLPSRRRRNLVAGGLLLLLAVGAAVYALTVSSSPNRRSPDANREDAGGQRRVGTEGEADATLAASAVPPASVASAAFGSGGAADVQRGDEGLGVSVAEPPRPGRPSREPGGNGSGSRGDEVDDFLRNPYR